MKRMKRQKNYWRNSKKLVIKGVNIPESNIDRAHHIGPRKEKKQAVIINLKHLDASLSYLESRVQLNRSWFVIHYKILNFQDWILCYHEPFHKKIKIWKSMEFWMDLWHLNNMKVILTLCTLNYVVCGPFSCIDSFHIVHNPAN